MSGVTVIEKFSKKIIRFVPDSLPLGCEWQLCWLIIRLWLWYFPFSKSWWGKIPERVFGIGASPMKHRLRWILWKPIFPASWWKPISKNILWLTSHSPGVRLLNYLGAEHGGRQLGWLRCHGLGWRVIVTISVDNKTLIILKFGSAPCHGWTSPVLPPVTIVSIFRWTVEQFREFGKLKHSKPSGIVSVQGKHLY